MKTIDELLTSLEKEINRLKVEFDIYFNNGSKRPPYETKNRVESLVKQLGDDHTLKSGARFRYNTIVARYFALRELWNRNLQEKEEGRDSRSIYTAAIKEQTVNQKSSTVKFQPIQVAFSDPKNEEENIQKLYQSVIAAKLECGESVNNASYQNFYNMILHNTDKLKSRQSTSSVSFSVQIEDGKVKLRGY